jgi:hypothetical protein
VPILALVHSLALRVFRNPVDKPVPGADPFAVPEQARNLCPWERRRRAKKASGQASGRSLSTGDHEVIELSQQAKPYQIPLPYGLALTVRPLSTSGMAAALTAARRSVEAIERQARERSEAGLPLDGLPDLSAGGERDGFCQGQLIRELAIRHVTSWTDVELEGGPAPPTPENIAAVIELYPVLERFFQEFTLR